MSTPRTITVTLGAGESSTLEYRGRHVAVKSCTVASFKAAFDFDAFETWYPGESYGQEKDFERIKIHDNLGGGCTIVLKISQVPMPDSSIQSSTLSAIQISTASTAVDIALVKALVDSADTSTLISRMAIDLVGGTPSYTLVAAANPNRKSIDLQADPDNAGNVYLGFTSAVSDVDSFAKLYPGCPWSQRFKGAIYAAADSAISYLRGSEIE